jgi:ceramidase
MKVVQVKPGMSHERSLTMTLGIANRDRPLLVFLALTIASLAALLLLPPILQSQDYHRFADARVVLGVPNFWNVISNIPFVVIGAVGLARHRETTAIVFIFFGIFLTGFGSSYYHWSPNDDTLFWDRLPMALAFMAILANAVEERVNARAGVVLLWPLLAVGVFSLLLWRWSGDLRLYAWVQFFPCVALPLMFLVFAPKYTGTHYWIIATVVYALAKAFEYLDEQIHAVGHAVSGHTLKHLTAAAACWVILRYFETRRPIP